jgi:choline dehydrogenase-like flavoprotein
MGFKIEAAPLQPLFAALITRGHGRVHAERMVQLPHTAAALALLRDGFHEESPGGEVLLRDQSDPVLDYPLNPYTFDGVKRAFLGLAELFFAAGAQKVHLAHGESLNYQSWAEARSAIEAFSYEPLRLRLGSAHVMGGCSLGSQPQESVVDETGRYHQLANLYVMDGSLFPSSLGVNPQLTIYALSAKFASHLV